ncbi:unnamed protein product, partial [Cladocopium goreaui]
QRERDTHPYLGNTYLLKKKPQIADVIDLKFRCASNILEAFWHEWRTTVSNRGDPPQWCSTLMRSKADGMNASQDEKEPVPLLPLHFRLDPEFASVLEARRLGEVMMLRDCNYHDPGNVCLDFCYFVLQLWKFVLPTKMSLINQISWRDYGGPKERSGTGAMNRRGNIIEALMANAMWQSKWEKEHSARKEKDLGSSIDKGVERKDLDSDHHDDFAERVPIGAPNSNMLGQHPPHLQSTKARKQATLHQIFIQEPWLIPRSWPPEEVRDTNNTPYINMARDQKELAYKNVSLTSGEVFQRSAQFSTGPFSAKIHFDTFRLGLAHLQQPLACIRGFAQLLQLMSGPRGGRTQDEKKADRPCVLCDRDCGQQKEFGSKGQNSRIQLSIGNRLLCDIAWLKMYAFRLVDAVTRSIESLILEWSFVTGSVERCFIRVFSPPALLVTDPAEIMDRPEMTEWSLLEQARASCRYCKYARSRLFGTSWRFPLKRCCGSGRLLLLPAAVLGAAGPAQGQPAEEDVAMTQRQLLPPIHESEPDLSSLWPRFDVLIWKAGSLPSGEDGPIQAKLQEVAGSDACEHGVASQQTTPVVLYLLHRLDRQEAVEGAELERSAPSCHVRAAVRKNACFSLCRHVEMHLLQLLDRALRRVGHGCFVPPAKFGSRALYCFLPLREAPRALWRLFHTRAGKQESTSRFLMPELTVEGEEGLTPDASAGCFLSTTLREIMDDAGVPTISQRYFFSWAAQSSTARYKLVHNNYVTARGEAPRITRPGLWLLNSVSEPLDTFSEHDQEEIGCWLCRSVEDEFHKLVTQKTLDLKLLDSFVPLT